MRFFCTFAFFFVPLQGISKFLMKHISTTYYCVAEHLFAIESSNDALLGMLSNYKPFQVYSPQDSPIFILHIEQVGLLHEEQRCGYQHVFTDNSEEDMPRIEVFREVKGENEKVKGEEEGWLMRVSQIAKSPICCEIECDAAFTKGVLHIAKDCRDVRFCIDNALMLLFAFRTAPLMTLEMHAAVVVKPCLKVKDEDFGYLFLGHSGTGKSTHARQWLAAFDDAWLLNDDNPILRVMDNGEVRVYGSPWSGKTPCYKNAHARVGGIIKLSQAPHNQLQPLSLPQAYAYIFSSASGLKIDKQMADHLYESIRYIITHVQCYHLDCLPDTHAAKVCFQGVGK